MLKIMLITLITILLNSCASATCIRVKIPLPEKLPVPEFKAKDVACASKEVREILFVGIAACTSRVRTLRATIEKANSVK